eukprot:TRINITY_DN18217_c0_g1_i1.p1 TRINITY_DN18217_c0_g1~~TRINITY_DN18217_c0_g1_i1.p1  ORF type:complete len:773 (-),score=202.69 TRINITY_DN18217_c0_g1_i1:24-2306(-)
MLSDINDHVRHQIDDAVIELRKLCTPYVEHIVPLHNWLDSVGKTLNATPPLLNVFVLGPPKSGKSTLLNALLGSALLPVTDAEDAEQFAPLEIVHMPGMQPLLKKAATGQHLAVTPSEIHHWLVEENKKWKAGAKPPHVFPMRLEVEVPVFGSAPFAETILNLVEGNSASVLSKTTQTPRSSLYSIVHTSLHADVVFYCIPYPHLKTDAEPVIFKALSDQLNPNVVPMLNERLFFVVTQIDEVLAAEHKIPNIHTLDKDPKFSSLEECRVYASNLIAKEFKFRVRPNQLALCSAHHALSSRIIRCQDPRPTVRQLYDYSELVHGSHYMQTIDDTPEAVLREACVNHSFVSEQNSGIKEVEDMLRIIDANSGRMLLCSAVTSALLHAQPYCSVLEQAIPLLQEETTRKADEHQALLDELDFVKRHLQTAVAELWLTIKEMRQGVADSWQEFWIMRLEELEAVLDGRDLFQFKDRQGTTIYELKRTVGRFDEFLPRYVRDRCYVEQRSREMGDAAPSGGSAFVHQNLAPILTVLERERLQLIMDVASSLAHHVKDEFEFWYPHTEELLLHRRQERVEHILQGAAELIKRTEQSTKEHFGTAEFTALVASDLALLSYDLRFINNALRDLPELVTALAEQLNGEPVIGLQRNILLRSWRLFVNQAKLSDYVLFEEDRLLRAGFEAIAQLEAFASKYASMLRQGLEMEEQEMEVANSTAREVHQQRERAPLIVAELGEVLRDLKSKNVWQTAMIQMYREAAAVVQ